MKFIFSIIPLFNQYYPSVRFILFAKIKEERGNVKISSSGIKNKNIFVHSFYPFLISFRSLCESHWRSPTSFFMLANICKHRYSFPSLFINGVCFRTTGRLHRGCWSKPAMVVVENEFNHRSGWRLFLFIKDFK